jgi:FeS assembly SUF system regulator
VKSVRCEIAMLRLNRMTDYAVVVLGQMARQPGLVQTAAHIAEGTAIPLPTASKLLKQMAGAALITSHRGANGGYSLDRAAQEVRVAEIVEVLDGPIALTACVDGAEDQCDVESLCPMRGNWNRVNNAIREALESVSLAELIDPSDLFPLADPMAATTRPERH